MTSKFQEVQYTTWQKKKKKKETHEIAKDRYIILWMKIRTRLPTENKALGSRSPGGPRERGVQ